MSTAWNFNYDKVITRDTYNIQPYYTNTGLSIDQGTNIIYGFSDPQMQELVAIFAKNRIVKVSLNVTYPGSSGGASQAAANEFLTRDIVNVSYLDLVNRTVEFPGDAFSLSSLSNASVNLYAYEGYLTEVATPLSGQQISNNFYFLSEGVTQSQEQISVLQDYRVNALSPLLGYIEYNGLEKKTASFYGGSELVLTATTVFNTTTVYDPNTLYAFEMAVDESAVTPNYSTLTIGGPTGADFALNHTFADVDEYCDYMNMLLINNHASQGYAFKSSSLVAPITWNVTTDEAAFYLRFDDEDDSRVVRIQMPENPNYVSLGALVADIQALLINNSETLNKITCSLSGSNILFEGVNNRTTGSHKIKLFDATGNDFLIKIGMTSDTEIFDYSNIIEFQPHDTTKVKIVGLDPYFKVRFKDGVTLLNALTTAGFDGNMFTGEVVYYHTPIPFATNNTLNFDGNFRSTTLNTNSIITLDASVSTLTATTLITGLRGDFVSLVVSPTPVTTELQFDVTIAGDTSLGTLEVSGTSLLKGAVTVEGVANTVLVEGITTLEGNVFITNPNHDAYRTLYKADLLSAGVLIPGNKPELETSDTSYLLYNGNFGAVDVDVLGTLAIHTDPTIVSSPVGRLYKSSSVAPNSSDAAQTLCYNGPMRAMTFTPGSARILKTDITPSTVNALQIILDTLVTDYKFKTDLGYQRIGFIADDTNPLLSGVNQDGVDITNCIGTLIKSVQELYNLIKG